MGAKDELFMERALKLAEEALKDGDYGVGALVVFGDEIISKGRNRVFSLQVPLAHAEIEAIDKIPSKYFRFRENMTIYSTCEPCIVCAGEIVSTGLRRLVYGASDPYYGRAGIVAEKGIDVSRVLIGRCEEIFLSNRKELDEKFSSMYPSILDCLSGQQQSAAAQSSHHI